jgi:replicative DNA helicase
VPEDFLSKQYKPLRRTIDFAHKKYSRDLSLHELDTLHRANNPTLTEAQKVNLRELMSELNSAPDIGADVAADVLEVFWKQEYGRQFAEIGIQMMNGEVDGGDGLVSIQSLIERCDKQFTPVDDVDYQSMDIEDILAQTSGNDRWKFNIPPLAQAITGVAPTHFIVAAARPNVGKCEVSGSLVTMYDGTRKRVDDLVIGDQLHGVDVLPRTVQALGSGYEECYRVTLRDGSYFECNKSHILSLKRKSTEGTKHKHGDVLNVNIEDYLKWPEGRKHRYSAWRFPTKTTRKRLPVDPWLFGVWLGDGTSSTASITSADPLIVQRFGKWVSYIYDNIHLQQTAYQNIRYSIKGKDARCNRTTNVNGFWEAMKGMGVVNNKHIPEVYFQSSFEQRRRLFAGLMDTDGHYYNGTYDIIQKNKRLADDIVRLAHSLGMSARIRECQKGCQTGAVGTYHRMRISPGKVAIYTALKYKAHKPNAKTKDSSMQKFTITPIGIKKYVGFTLDRDSLYLTGCNIVTHNTSFHATLSAAPGGWAWQGARIAIALNEESSPRIAERYVTTATGLTREQIAANRPYAHSLFAPIADNIKMFRDSDMSIASLNAYCKRHKPDILIIDMIDKVRIPGTFAREDQMYRAIYKEAREIGNRHNCVVMGFSQLSAEAEGKTQLNQAMLEGSRTGKAAEADLMLLIGRGASSDTATDDDGIRYLSIAKNKLNGVQRKIPVMLHREIGRYTE